MEIKIIVALIILSLGIILFVYRDNKKDRRDSLVLWITTLIGVFISVYMAFYVTQTSILKEEKNQIKGLILQTQEETQKEIATKTQALVFISMMTKGKESDKSFFADNPTYGISMLKALLSNNLFAKHCYSSSYYLFRMDDQLNVFASQLNDPDNKFEEQLVTLRIYINQLERTRDLLAVYVNCVDGEIDKNKINEINNKYIQKLLKK